MDEDKEFDPCWKGEGASLHAALDDAWETAKKDGADPGTYVVEEIAIETVNPIRSYIVIIRPGG
jgi:hypothetical protein